MISGTVVGTFKSHYLKPKVKLQGILHWYSPIIKKHSNTRQDQVLVRLFARLAEPRTMVFPKVIAGLVLETRGLG